MAEYEANFDELSRFAPLMVKEDVMRAQIQVGIETFN